MGITHLGKARRLYSRRFSFTFGMGFVAVLFLVGAGAVLFGVQDVVDRAFIGLAALGFGVVIGLLALTSLWSCVVVFDLGMAERGYHYIKSIRWDDIESFYSRLERDWWLAIPMGRFDGIVRHYHIVSRTQVNISLDDSIRHVDHLASLVEEGIFPRLYERDAEAFYGGEIVTYGPVSVSLEDGIAIAPPKEPGIHAHGGFRWYDIYDHGIGQGHLIVRGFASATRFLSSISAPVGEIPNISVLLALLDTALAFEEGVSE